MPSAKLRFRDYELDPDGFELRRAGHRLRLERKPMELLILLAEKQGQLVKREEIIEKIWGKGFFFDAENGINNAVRKIRSALNDDPEQPRFVETSVGKGYRFIAPVERVLEPTGSQPSPASAPSDRSKLFLWKRAWLPPLVGITLIASAFAFNLAGIRSKVLGQSMPPIHSIVVLPLENLSGDTSQEYFVDGMTDALITDLAQVSSLRVISRTSAMHYKGSHPPLPAIARELNVDAVVEGTVIRSGDRVRITAQLLDARSDRHLWAKAYDRDIGEVISLQEEVADSIVNEIQHKLTYEGTVRLRSKHKVSHDVYEDYLRGLYFFDKREPEASKKSADYFRKAIGADPEFAPAYAGLAEALPALNWFNDKPPVEAMEGAKKAAKRALELDDRSAEGHAALGALLSLYDWNWSEAEKELKHALELNPNSPLAHERYSMLLQSTGRVSEGLIEAERARQLDPLSFFMNRELGRSLYLARRYDEAFAQLRRAEELKPSREHWISLVLEQQGKKDEAIRLRLQTNLDTMVEVSLDEIDSLRQAYVAAGWNGYWTRWIQLNASGERGTVGPYFIAAAEARLGHADKTWEWMEKSADQREVWVTWVKVDPVFDQMRYHAGYKKLLQRMNLMD